MYELWNVENNELMLVGSIREISKKIDYTVQAIYISLYNNRKVGNVYQVKKIHQREKIRLDVFKDNQLIYEDLTYEEVAKKLGYSDTYLRTLKCKNKSSKDGYSIIESGCNYA